MKCKCGGKITLEYLDGENGTHYVAYVCTQCGKESKSPPNPPRGTFTKDMNWRDALPSGGAKWIDGKSWDDILSRDETNEE